MGVPVRVTVGRSRQHPGIPEALSLAPWGLHGSRKWADATDEEAAAHYWRGLDGRQPRVWRELTDLALEYPGQRLVLLCFERLSDVGPMGCHRRWAAEWFGTVAGLEVPELTPVQGVLL